MFNRKYIRPQKSFQLDKIYSQYKNFSGKLGAKIYNNTIFTPVDGIGVGVTYLWNNNQIVDDCNFICEINKNINHSEQINTIKERVLYAGFYRAHWGHFIASSLSRLWYYFKFPDLNVNKIIFAIPKGTEKPVIKNNIKRIFEYLGILDKIEFINCPTKFEQIIVPDLSFSLENYYSEEYNIPFDLIIKKIVQENQQDKTLFPEKIFFTRSKLDKAKIAEIGIEVLDDVFQKNGYKIIYPEDLTLSEMVLILQNAKEVAGVAGSTIHNICFGKKGQSLTILERNVINNTFQSGINLARNLNVTYIDSFLTINSVNLSLGPFFYYPTKYLTDFLKDKKLALPSDKFMSETYLKRQLKKYFKTWKQFYNYQWYYQDISIKELYSFYTSYKDSEEVTGKYLKGYVPLFFKDKISLRRNVKNLFNKNSFIYNSIYKFYKLIR